MGAYSRILLPWDSQPQEAVEVDSKWDLTSLVLPGQSSLDIVGGVELSTASGTPTKIVGPYGQALELNSTTDGIRTTATARQIANTAEISIIWVGHLLAAGDLASALGGISYALAALTPPYVFCEIKRARSGLADNIYLNFSTGGVERALDSGLTTYTTGACVVVGTIRSGKQSLYIRHANGLDFTGATQSGTLSVTSTARLEIGEASGLGRNSNSACAMQAISGRAWTDQEALSLLANPWQLFAPRTIFVPITTSSGGTTYTITPSGGIVFSGTGTEINTKVLDVSGGVTFAGTGSVTFASGGTSYIISPSGGVTLAGTGTQVQSKVIIPSGGISFAGTGLDLRTKVIDISGGVTFGGTGSMTSNTSVVTGTVGERTKVGVGT